MNSGWKQVAVEDFADLCLGKMLDKAKNRGEPRPYLRNLNVRWFDFDLTDLAEMPFEANEVERYSAREGDLLVCEGGYPGRAAIWQGDPIFFQKAIHRVRCHEQVRARWLLYFLLMSDMNGSLADHFTGTGIQHFTGQAFKKLKVPLPPLAEQQRIISILDESFEGIAVATANARQNAQSALQLSSDALTAEFKRGESVAGTVALRQLCSFENGDRGENYPNKSARVADGIPFINAGHLSGRCVNMTEMDYIAPERFALLRSGKPKDGDVLFCLRGSLGKFGVVNGIGDCAIASSLVIVRPNASALPEYIAAYFDSGLCAEMIETYRSGTAQPNLGAKQLADFRIPALNPTEQAALVERVNAFSRECRTLADLNERKIAALTELKQSLLARAFSGELTREPIAA